MGLFMGVDRYRAEDLGWRSQELEFRASGFGLRIGVGLSLSASGFLHWVAVGVALLQCALQSLWCARGFPGDGYLGVLGL